MNVTLNSVLSPFEIMTNFITVQKLVEGRKTSNHGACAEPLKRNERALRQRLFDASLKPKISY